MADDQYTKHNQGATTFKPSDVKEPLGKYVEEWTGVNVDKHNKYDLTIEFSAANDACKVTYHRNNTQVGSDIETLVLDFQVDKVVVEGIKNSIYLNKGHGEYVKANENRTERLDNQEMIAFVVHPMLDIVFGVDLPKVMLHDLRLQKRKLTRPWVKK